MDKEQYQVVLANGSWYDVRNPSNANGIQFSRQPGSPLIRIYSWTDGMYRHVEGSIAAVDLLRTLGFTAQEVSEIATTYDSRLK